MLERAQLSSAVCTATLLAWILSASSAAAATLCVNPGGSGGCFASVQVAVDAAADGDEIEIAAGTYTERVAIPAKRLSLSGVGVVDTLLAGGTDPALVLEDGARVSARAMTFSTDGPNGLFAAVRVGEFRRTVLALEDCKVIGNPGVNGLGIWARTRSKVALRRCIVSGAGGGGIRVDQGSLRLESTLISGSNTGLSAGASRVRIRNSTIANNGHQGISTSGDPKRRTRMTIRSSTISGNGGDAIFAYEGRVRFASSIVDGPCTYAENLISLGGNLFSECIPSSGRIDLDLVGADPLLGPLQDNGGPTETMLPGAGSPAIDALGRKHLCGQADQRGVARGVPCDIGAVDTP